MTTIAIAPYPAWGDVYLTELRQHGLENTAAATAGTTPRAVRRLCELNSDFAYAVEDALEASVDLLEAEARRRAVDGVEKGVYYQGDRVATEVQYSDSLLLAFLKGKRRREFGDKAEISGPGGAPLTVNIRTFGNGAASANTPLGADAAAELTGEIIDASFRALDHELDADELV